MLAYTRLITVEEHREGVKQLIRIVDPTLIDDEDYHDLLRSFDIMYFDEYVAGTEYKRGNKFVYNGIKYLMITDMPQEHLNTEPSFALMRAYCLAYQGMYANLWAFKEPVRVGMIRYPYGQEEVLYTATRNATSAENVYPPNEDPTGLWVLSENEIV